MNLTQRPRATDRRAHADRGGGGPGTGHPRGDEDAAAIPGGAVAARKRSAVLAAPTPTAPHAARDAGLRRSEQLREQSDPVYRQLTHVMARFDGARAAEPRRRSRHRFLDTRRRVGTFDDAFLESEATGRGGRPGDPPRPTSVRDRGRTARRRNGYPSGRRRRRRRRRRRDSRGKNFSSRSTTRRTSTTTTRSGRAPETLRKSRSRRTARTLRITRGWARRI